MAINSVRWSLFGKFAIGISITVLIFGALNAIIVRNSISNSLNDEFEKRGYFISRALAEQSVSYILANDPAGLNMLINEIMAIDSLIHYAFITNGAGNVLAHSFREQVPATLVHTNVPPDNDLPGIVSVRDIRNPDLLIRDFSMVVMSLNMGTARVGMLENEIRDQVRATVYSLLVMVAVFFFIGLLAALFFSYTIATPLKVLSLQSAIMDIRNIEAGLTAIKVSTQKPYYRLRRFFGMKDEIDVLYENYADMLRRLGKAYHDLNRLQQSVLQSEKLAAIGTLTAGVAHEINNPLAGMSIGLKRIHKEPGNISQVIEYTGLMQEALSRIEQVVNDLLTFSRKDDEASEYMRISDLVRKTIKLARYRVKSENIVFRFEDHTDNVLLYVSPNRIEQVFLNVIINSIDSIMEKMSRQKSFTGQIDIAITNSNDSVQLVFADNGTGIPDHIIDKIFDPFFTTKSVGKGTGLGLSVSYEIISKHGGKIFAESEAGKGSRIIIHLPKSQ